MTDFPSAQLQRELLDGRPATPFFDGPQDAVVVSATPSTCYVAIPDFDADSAFGPAPYPRPALHAVSLSTIDGISPNPHNHDVGVPPKGTACLVEFVGTGIDKPRVVCFYGWPT